MIISAYQYFFLSHHPIRLVSSTSTTSLISPTPSYLTTPAQTGLADAAAEGGTDEIWVVSKVVIGTIQKGIWWKALYVG